MSLSCFLSSLSAVTEPSEVTPVTDTRDTADSSVSCDRTAIRWALEGFRSPVIGVPRSPIPTRTQRQAAKTTRSISKEGLATRLAVMKQAISADQHSRRDYALIKKSSFLYIGLRYG